MEFDVDDNSSKEYKVEAIWDSAVYTKELKSGYLSCLYYLVSWIRYPEEENIWKPALVVQHLKKLISLFHKDHLTKPIANFLAVNIASQMARPIVKLVESIK